MNLPDSPAAFADATWSDIAPYFEALAAAPLDETTVAEWLATWSRLEELLSEAGTVAMIAYTGDTADPAKEAAHLRFSMQIFPLVDEQQVRLAKRLLDVGYAPPDLATTVRRFRTDAEIFREANVPLFSELEELSAAYQKITGGLSAEWDGQRKTIPQLQPFLKSPDRAVRERAFRLGAGAYLEKRDELADLFDRMYALRTRVAENAGFGNYEDFCFAAKHRFDYTPADCRRFHDAVERTVVPALERLSAYRKSRLGVDVLRPWDLQVDVERGGAPLKPFDTVDDFVGGARRVFHQVDPELGAQFDILADERLLDLESRPGKAPGGYCTNLHVRGRPFIFMNAVGVPDDVSTLVHEAGHCFHDFAMTRLPLVWQRTTGHEAAELASMSMELLAAPSLARPVGFYDDDDARAARIEHLVDVLESLAHIASVDAFQSWIYTSGRGGDAAARDAAWLEIRQRFDREADWTGLEPERIARWYRQLHIFEIPFYYIEYGIAQLGALQVWRRSLTDHAEAVRRYRGALALGGTRSLPEIYEAAGARLVFDAEGMGELVALVEEEIDRMREAAIAR
ncbi:oligoendopeptidase, M3 family [Gemmatirosa kalamazoonensis]|uniref:Oligoendopeptidase, M3 family n=1 Tax=Gemmatirosa kalamazoonensis TaxID=861299 RepID=W0RL94_9BACT|nr:M3 family oligoendopeptidase [Gemmatirosa kalamazoonensis]AHG91202.1 oligoendopeptidase, M3 family [Gemmatirosa kalamazoonensis]